MPELAVLLRPALLGLAAMAVLAAATWVVSTLRHNVAYVDRIWSLLFVSATLVYAQALPGTGPRAAWVLALVLAWGLRLCAHITWRGWGHDEDRRYQAIRQRNQPHFAFKSLFIVFGLQAVLGWVVSTPLLAALASPQALNAADAMNGVKKSNLALRVISAVVLFPLAIAFTVWGGLPFALLAGGAAAVAAFELIRMFGPVGVGEAFGVLVAAALPFAR